MNPFGMGGDYTPFGDPRFSQPFGYGYEQANPYEQGMNYGAYNVPHRRATTKKDILNYIAGYACPSEIEQVTDFDTEKTRHICKGFKEIVLLVKQIIQVPTSSGVVNVEVFFCPRCRKIIINHQSLEVY